MGGYQESMLGIPATPCHENTAKEQGWTREESTRSLLRTSKAFTFTVLRTLERKATMAAKRLKRMVPGGEDRLFTMTFDGVIAPTANRERVTLTKLPFVQGEGGADVRRTFEWTHCLRVMATLD